MSIWNKILLGLIFVASLVFFHAAARTVKTYQYWAGQADEFEKKLKEVQRRDRPSCRRPITSTPSRTRRSAFSSCASIWAACWRTAAAFGRSARSRRPIDPDRLRHHGRHRQHRRVDSAFTKKMLLYAFEEGDDQSPGKYLGEFRVDAVSDKQVVLASTTQMVDFARQECDGEQGSLGLVRNDARPTSTRPSRTCRKIKGSGSRTSISRMVSRSTPAARFLRSQGQEIRTAAPRLPGDFPGLRDVSHAVSPTAGNRPRRDLSYLKAADKEAKNQEALVEKEKTQVDERTAAGRKRERTAVADSMPPGKACSSIYQAGVKEAIAKNLKYAQEIARLQKEAADQIDRRTRSMAQFGPGAN